MEQLIDALFTHGYYVWDDFLNEDEVAQLRECIPADWKNARIGRNEERALERKIRSDKIQWLQPTMGFPVKCCLQTRIVTVLLDGSALTGLKTTCSILPVNPLKTEVTIVCC